MDDERASILLANKQGGFAWLAAQPESRYQGVFFKLGEQTFKTLAHLAVNEPLKGVTDMLWGAQREYEHTNQRVCMPSGTNALLVEFSAPTTADVMLDCKIIDDNREWGRTYEISSAQGCVLITFRKRNDDRDDDTTNSQEYDLFLALAGDRFEFFPVKEWVEQHYPYDEHRQSRPWSRWVFKAGSVHAQRFVLAAGLTKTAAVREAKRVLSQRMMFVHKQMHAVEQVVAHKPLPKHEIDLAYACARNALDQLIVDQELAAGYPWFTQCWTRDALVSSKALALIGRQTLAKRLVQCFAAQESLTTRPGSQLIAADAPGWLAVRCNELSPLFNAIEKKRLLKGLRQHRAQLRMDQGLVVNNAHETWMDSESRDGARIEVQALALALFKLLKDVDAEHALRHRVRETFWNGAYLHDGLDDPTIRPNLFIAAYVYPELLTQEEWECCFDAVLPKLWLPWGGLATIDKGYPSFHDAHTGENPASYHHGDSWFWLNNLAALVLHRTNKEKYKHYIDQILDASSYEILQLGAISHHAELSSARALSSHGCVSQAWSAAMFIELCDEAFS